MGVVGRESQEQGVFIATRCKDKSAELCSRCPENYAKRGASDGAGEGFPLYALGALRVSTAGRNMADSHETVRCELRRNAHQSLNARSGPEHEPQRQASFLRTGSRIWVLRHGTEFAGGAARQFEQRSVVPGRHA